MGVHGDGYKDLMAEDGTHRVSGVLFDGGKCIVGLSMGGIFSCGGSIGKVDGLCVWVEICE